MNDGMNDRPWAGVILRQVDGSVEVGVMHSDDASQTLINGAKKIEAMFLSSYGAHMEALKNRETAPL
jgi:hypothetical protein